MPSFIVWLAACVVALMGNVLPFSLIHWGEQYVDSSLTAILMGVMPVAVALMAVVMRRQWMERSDAG